MTTPTAPDGDRLPATNSGQETCRCPEVLPGLTKHPRLLWPDGPPCAAPQQPPAQEQVEGVRSFLEWLGVQRWRVRDDDGRPVGMPSKLLAMWRAEAALMSPPAQEREEEFQIGEGNGPSTTARLDKRVLIARWLRKEYGDLVGVASETWWGQEADDLLSTLHPAPPSEADRAGEGGLWAIAKAIQAAAEAEDGIRPHSFDVDGVHEVIGTPEILARIALAASPGVQGGDGR